MKVWGHSSSQVKGWSHVLIWKQHGVSAQCLRALVRPSVSKCLEEHFLVFFSIFRWLPRPFRVESLSPLVSTKALLKVHPWVTTVPAPLLPSRWPHMDPHQGLALTLTSGAPCILLLSSLSENYQSSVWLCSGQLLLLLSHFICV